MNNQLPVPSVPPNGAVPAAGADYQPFAPQDEGAGAGKKFPLHKFVAFLRKFWWVPVVTLAFAAVAAAGYVFWKPPVFVSQARMWETVKLRLPEGTLFSEDVQNFLGTQSDLLQSAALRDLALARLKTTTTNFTIPLGEDGLPLPVKIRVAQAAKSSVFLIEASSSSPAYTRSYLDALMSVYLEYKRNIRKVISGDTLASMSEQVLRLERDLKNEQEALTLFQRSNNLAILQEESTAAGSYLARLKTQLSDLQLENSLLQATLQEASKTNGSFEVPSWADASAGMGATGRSRGSGGNLSALQELRLLKQQREQLSKYLRPKHPKVAKLDAEIERASQLVEIYRRQNREQLAATLQANQLKMDNTVGSTKEWEKKVVEANARLGEAERLKQNVTRAQSVYDRMAQLVQNVGISRNIDQETLAILEPASSPVRSRREDVNTLMMASLGGVALGVVLILLAALRDDRLVNVADVSEHFVDVVVGQVPELPEQKHPAGLSLIEAEDPRHIYAESYRSLRSAILFPALDGVQPKVILVTSAVPAEGKSTIVANLARTLALGGARVLLVDGDMRRGHLHRLMKLNGEPGLAEVLQEAGNLQECTQTNCLPNLAFLSRGKMTANPGDLLCGGALDKLLEQMRRQYDYVLIDSCPLFAADDAATLAPKTDGTLVVVRSRFSRARAVREALDILYRRQVRVLGLIFNRADTSSTSYYYYKYADYYEPVSDKDQAAEATEIKG